MRTLLFLFLPTLAVFAACKTQVTTTGTCGDDFIDPGEACDGSQLPVRTCEELGYHVQTGALRCTAACGYDLSVCSLSCGDGLLSEEHEQCEGTDLGGQSCQSLGMGAGQLACDANCRYDATGCESQAICGDGTLTTPFEQCEGADLDGQTCQTLGWHDGALACTLTCELDLEPCRSFGRCGDGLIQDTYGERCEGTDLGGETCVTLGWHGGELLCSGDCTFNEAPCAAVGRCGDDAIQAEFGEHCDGTDLDGRTCALEGFRAGELACAPDCGGLDLRACTNGQVGEACATETDCQSIDPPLVPMCLTTAAGITFPFGYCTAMCDSGAEPDPCVVSGGSCEEVQPGYRFCLKPCTNSSQCRAPDYVCAPYAGLEGTWCVPAGR